MCNLQVLSFDRIQHRSCFFWHPISLWKCYAHCANNISHLWRMPAQLFIACNNAKIRGTCGLACSIRTGAALIHFSKKKFIIVFAWLISHTFSVNKYYFSLTTNQPTILLSHVLSAERTGQPDSVCFFNNEHYSA